jgi:hypothetical protein
VDVHLHENPADRRYFKLGPIHARRLGLRPHPDYPQALILEYEDWEDTAIEPGTPRLYLPNGQYFTAEELTTLSHKSGDPDSGWEVWADDPGGYPSCDLPKAPFEVTE